MSYNKILSYSFLQIANDPAKVVYEDIIEALKTFDKDNSGHVNGGEFRQILLNVGDKLTEEQVDVIMGPHEDESGMVQYRTMVEILMKSWGY